MQQNQSRPLARDAGESFDDWQNRWLGGMCSLAAMGGPPIRGAEYPAHPSMADSLLLDGPAAATVSGDEANSIWQHLLGCQVVAVKNPGRARLLLMRAAGIEAGQPVGIPANASRSLVEAVKRSGAATVFLPLDTELNVLAGSESPTTIWLQPSAGVAGLPRETRPGIFVDHMDSLPVCMPEAEAAVFGLHLSPDPEKSGALIATRSCGLASRLRSLITEDDAPSAGLVYAQYLRTVHLIDKQTSVIARTNLALRAAVGLQVLDASSPSAIPLGVAVRIPRECDASTFFSYITAENTPITWAPLLWPVHYRAAAAHRGTAENLAQWLLLRVGPDFTSEEIAHAVLGLVKTSDYLGVRWRQNPERAYWYADFLDELYGDGHDAFRPAFPRGPQRGEA